MFWRKKPTQEVEIARAVVHRYRAGDLIVLKSEKALPSHLVRGFVRRVESLLPGAKVIFLDKGLEIEVVRDETPRASSSDMFGVASALSRTGYDCSTCGCFDAPLAPEGASKCPECGGRA